MKERPIIFNTEMVKAILEGRKTVTRRPAKFPLMLHHAEIAVNSIRDNEDKSPYIIDCPFGQIGDRLYVRETHFLYGKWVKNGRSKTGRQKYKFIANRDYDVKYLDCPPYKISTSKNELGWFKRPSIYMPKWAARIWPEITDVRVERVQDITEDQAQAEGMGYLYESYLNIVPDYDESLTRKQLFQCVWDSVYGNFDDNPWVWVIEFKVIKKGAK